MYNGTIQPPETNGTLYWLGPSLLGAEFVRSRVCQGPRLSGVEMSLNRSTLCHFEYAIILQRCLTFIVFLMLH